MQIYAVAEDTAAWLVIGLLTVVVIAGVMLGRLIGDGARASLPKLRA